MKTNNREQWCQTVLVTIINDLITADFNVEPKSPYRVSIGFPKGGNRSKDLAKAYPSSHSTDGHIEVFVSPDCPDARTAVHWLLNLSQQVVFDMTAKAARVRVLKRAMDDFEDENVDYILDKVGDWPHAPMLAETKKDSTRQIKLECECGCIMRASRKWIEQMVLPAACPVCQSSTLDVAV